MPPGRTTRRISAAALAGSGTKLSTRPETAASKLSSSKGSACASPTRNSACGARVRAKARKPSDGSTPATSARLRGCEDRLAQRARCRSRRRASACRRECPARPGTPAPRAGSSARRRAHTGRRRPRWREVARVRSWGSVDGALVCDCSCSARLFDGVSARMRFHSADAASGRAMLWAQVWSLTED